MIGGFRVSGMLTFQVPDPGHLLAGVRLAQEVRIPGDQLDFRRTGDGWQLDLPRPPVSRMEYLLELRHADGSRELVTDQANPLRVLGAFGEKSVLEFPGYRPRQVARGRDLDVGLGARRRRGQRAAAAAAGARRAGVRRAGEPGTVPVRRCGGGVAATNEGRLARIRAA